MENFSTPNYIQSYNLFGESSDMPDVVHCESIAARSTLNNWEFSPHRHRRLHQVLLIEKGGGLASIEGRDVSLGAGDVVNIPSGCVHGFRFDPATVGNVVTIAAEVLDQVFVAPEGVQPIFNQAGIFPATHEIGRVVKSISREHLHMNFGRAQVLRALIAQLIGLIARVISDGNTQGEILLQTPLMERFESLVDAQYKNHWPLVKYAQALAVTTGHLSRITRQATGLSASQIITARIIREARRNLIYTNLAVSEIAYDLGFGDPAYFSRVFSRATGLSPRNFRARLEARPMQAETEQLHF